MSDEEPVNEIVAAAAHARDSARRSGAKAWPLTAIGLGVGIGSAAVAAAMLYANRDRKRDAGD